MRILLLFFSCLTFFGGGLPAHADSTDPFSWFVEVKTSPISSGKSVPIEVHFEIPPHHHLYQDKTQVEVLSDEWRLGSVEKDLGLEKPDPWTGKPERIYEIAATLRATLVPTHTLVSGRHDIRLAISYQGCSSTLCFRLNRKETSVTVDVTGSGEVSPSRLPFEKGFWMVLLVCFLGGIASAFTPCVLPVIPITLAFVGVRKEDLSGLKNLWLSSTLVLSMSLAYALLGLGAASLGKGLGFLYQSPYFLLIGSALFVAFALSLFGLFEIQLPLFLRNRLSRWGGQGTLGAILSGITVGALAAPCVGPLVGALLLYVGETRDLAKGFLFLFVYGLGMGIVFLLFGLFYRRLSSHAHGGVYLVWIKRLLGVLLLIPAFYYGSVAFKQLRPAAPVHSVFWKQDVPAAFEEARRSDQPLFVDFFASWCLPCLEMEKNTFSDASVRAFLEKNFIPLRVDCTEETPVCNQLVEKYSVVGWPTFLILDPQGNSLDRMVGESLGPDQLIQRLSPYAH